MTKVQHITVLFTHNQKELRMIRRLAREKKMTLSSFCRERIVKGLK